LGIADRGKKREGVFTPPDTVRGSGAAACRLLSEQLVGGRDQPDRRIDGTVGAELLRVFLEPVGIEDRRIIFVPVVAVQPRKYDADRFLVAFQELLAGGGREIDLFRAGGAGDKAKSRKNKAVSIFMWSFLSNILRERHRHMEDSSGWYPDYFCFANNFSAGQKSRGDVGGFQRSIEPPGREFRDRLRTVDSNLRAEGTRVTQSRTLTYLSQTNP